MARLGPNLQSLTDEVKRQVEDVILERIAFALGNNILDAPNEWCNHPSTSAISGSYYFPRIWWFLPTLGGEMQRVNTHRFFDLGMRLSPLRAIAGGQKISPWLPHLILARNELSNFLDYLPFEVCRPIALKVVEAIDSILPREPNTGQIREDVAKKALAGDITIDAFQAYAINDNIQRFETILSAELPTLATYFISQVGAYSTADLIERAEVVFSENIRQNLLTQVLFDIREAGKCIVFNTPTAAGFHILRATEATIREYYAVVTNNSPRPRNRDWGAYIRVLRSSSADQKIVAMLDQIRDMHRNPLIHPEESLNREEAIELFDICKSAIQAITRDIVKRRPPTTLP